MHAAFGGTCLGGELGDACVLRIVGDDAARAVVDLRFVFGIALKAAVPIEVVGADVRDRGPGQCE